MGASTISNFFDYPKTTPKVEKLYIHEYQHMTMLGNQCKMLFISKYTHVSGSVGTQRKNALISALGPYDIDFCDKMDCLEFLNGESYT